MSQKYLKNTSSKKGFSAQYSLVALLEKWKSCNDFKENSFGALMTDFLKAFDCLSHELIFTKLFAYGFNQEAVELMNMSERKQRTKLRIHYSYRKKIPFGVPHESILGPLLFNIFLCDLFVHFKRYRFC